MSAETKTKKRQYLRNLEYYQMQETFDKLYQQSKDNKQFRHLMETISSENNIKLAYRNLKTNKGKNTPGTDRKTIKFYKKIPLDKFVKEIQKSLQNYHPGSVRRVEIPKENGKTRPLGIPCMKDRIIQQCILQVLQPICEAKFHPHSYGFRPNRSCHHAIARFNYLVNQAHFYYVVDIDIKSFFDNVDHAKLLKQIWTLGIQDKNLLTVIKKILKSEVKGIGIPNKGTPQGGVISPLLSNIVLNELDWWISDQWETFQTDYKYSPDVAKYYALKNSKKKNRNDPEPRKMTMKEMFIVRYADDFKILCKDSKTAFKILNAVKLWLRERLQLEISPEKSKVTNLLKNYTEFLGIKLKVRTHGKYKENQKYPEGTPKQSIISHISDKNVKRIQNNLKEQIIKIQHKPTPNNVKQLNLMIRGIHNYYRVATHGGIDMGRINYNLRRTLYNRLKPSDKGEHSKTYLKIYGDYAKKKVQKVAKVDIYPIYGMKFDKERTKCLNQSICNYTKQGRKPIHDQIPNLEYLIRHIILTATQDSVEYSDNRISKLFQQLGKCAISGIPLKIYIMCTHHILPKILGGTDEYKNLIWLLEPLHRLIHANELSSTIKLVTYIKYEIYEKTLNKSEVKQILKKVDSFRVKAGNWKLLDVYR